MFDALLLLVISGLVLLVSVFILWFWYWYGCLVALLLVWFVCVLIMSLLLLGIVLFILANLWGCLCCCFGCFFGLCYLLMCGCCYDLLVSCFRFEIFNYCYLYWICLVMVALLFKWVLFDCCYFWLMLLLGLFRLYVVRCCVCFTCLLYCCIVALGCAFNSVVRFAFLYCIVCVYGVTLRLCDLCCLFVEFVCLFCWLTCWLIVWVYTLLCLLLDRLVIGLFNYYSN